LVKKIWLNGSGRIAWNLEASAEEVGWASWNGAV
jgi:hypothetical protein